MYKLYIFIFVIIKILVYLQKKSSINTKKKKKKTVLLNLYSSTLLLHIREGIAKEATSTCIAYSPPSHI